MGPVNSLVQLVGSEVPRLLINRDAAGIEMRNLQDAYNDDDESDDEGNKPHACQPHHMRGGFRFARDPKAKAKGGSDGSGDKLNKFAYRDFWLKGMTCDEGCTLLQRHMEGGR